MKILCIADSHGDYTHLQQLVEQHPEVPLVLHAGDGVGELLEMHEQFPKLEYAAAQGNCDRMEGFGLLTPINVRGVEILITHGHLYAAKRGMEELYALGKERKPRVILFGHTHKPYLEEYEGVLYLNPGSLFNPHGLGHYAFIEIEERGKVRGTLCTLEG